MRTVFRPSHALALLVLALPHIAIADVAPPNLCNKVGAECDRAGRNYDEPGICKATTCSTAGGRSKNPCNLCESEGGVGPSSGKSTSRSSGCLGCEVGSVDAEVGPALAASLGALGALVYKRARRRARKRS